MVSRPVLQKQIERLPTLSASKRKREVSSRRLVVNAASSREHQFGSGDHNMVDANMILLRKRMFDLKMQDKNDKTPEERMEWEKKLYPAYHAHVLMAMQWLQCSLINTHPIVAFTLLGLISASVSLSVVIVWATALSQLNQII